MSIFTNPASSWPEDTARYVDALLGLLGDNDPVAVLRETAAAVRRILDRVPADIAGRPEAPGKWSMREVVQHLADSDLVGGFRLRMVLAHDRPVLTGYDQDLCASRLGYRDADVRQAFDQFAALRAANVRLWERLTPADLARVGLHAERGEESVEHMRRLYAAHDLLHIRQLERIRAALTPESV
jgi:DinB superfamily